MRLCINDIWQKLKKRSSTGLAPWAICWLQRSFSFPDNLPSEFWYAQHADCMCVEERWQLPRPRLSMWMVAPWRCQAVPARPCLRRRFCCVSDRRPGACARDSAVDLIALVLPNYVVVRPFHCCVCVYRHQVDVVGTSSICNRAHGVVVSHPLSMREALGSIPSVSI